MLARARGIRHSPRPRGFCRVGGSAGVLSNTSAGFHRLLSVAFLRERLSLSGWIGTTAFNGASMFASGRDERPAMMSAPSSCWWRRVPFFAVPLLAMLLSWLALGEVPSVVMPAWAALAICGTLLVIVFGRQIG